MNRIKNLLTGVDLSHGSRAALHQALRLAAANHATLHITHVIDTEALEELAGVLGVPAAEQTASALTVGRGELAAWLQPFSLPHGCHTEVLVGRPADTLLQRAAEVQADLIVMGAQGQNTTSPEAGLLALRVLRQAPRKVLLVDSAHERPFLNIVACVDFSPSAQDVVDQAKRVAALGARRVDFLHVYDPPWRRLGYLMPAFSANQDLQDAYLNMLRRQLKDLVGEVPGLPARLVLHEAPVHKSGIAAYAELHDADLIVLATKARPNLAWNLPGSTAERLVRELPCSVLTVKPRPLGVQAT